MYSLIVAFVLDYYCAAKFSAIFRTAIIAVVLNRDVDEEIE
jgi:hypothetical protein